MKKTRIFFLLFLSFTLLLSACGSTNQTNNEAAVSSSINDIFEPGIRYQIEPISLLPYKTFTSSDIGSSLLYNDLIYTPRVVERFKFSDTFIDEYDFVYWNYGSGIEIQPHEVGVVASIIELVGPHGEHLIVGQDIEYGKDFSSLPYFIITVIDYENDNSEFFVACYFDDDVIHVNILSIDIVCPQKDDGVLLLVNQVHENGETSVLFAKLSKNQLEHNTITIDQNLLGGRNVFVLDAMFDTNGNMFFITMDSHSQKNELIVLDPTGKIRLVQSDVDVSTQLTRAFDGDVWLIESVMTPSGATTSMRMMSATTWTWINEFIIPLDYVNALYAAPEYSEFMWFANTENGLYGVTVDEVSRILLWHDVDINISYNTELLFPSDGVIIVLNKDIHPWNENAFKLDSVILRRTDAVDEREILSVGGVHIKSHVLNDLVRQFNRVSETHRAVIVDYAETGEWDGVAMRLRTDLIRGEGPDVVVFNQWGDENDITSALMRGGFLADLNVFLSNDPELSREDFFENILDIWTNAAGELSLITGTVIPTPYWGPSEKLDSFTDFTHEGFLAFIRDSQAQGVTYPMGLNFLPYVILQTMLYADNTFFCFETGEANFESDLFLDILSFAAGIPDEQQQRWMEAMETGEAFNPVALIAQGEQLMTSMYGLIEINDFRVFDATVGGLSIIGAPNAAGELSIATRPIMRMGIRANSQNAIAAWEFIRLTVLYPNNSGTQGFPILRSIFEDDINEALNADSKLAGDFFGFADGMEIPALTEERASVLRSVMEGITHEYHPDPHIMAIIWEDTAPFFVGMRTAEETSRIIQSRVSIYLAEQMSN